MGNMINSQPRFGIEEENGVTRIFDYATGRYTAVEGNETIRSVDGEWNTQELVNLIKTQQPLFGARLDGEELTRDDAVEHQRALAEEQRRDKVEQFKEDFLADGTGDNTAEREAQMREQAERDHQAAAEEEARRQQLAAQERTDGGSNPPDQGHQPQQ